MMSPGAGLKAGGLFGRGYRGRNARLQRADMPRFSFV